MLRDVEWGKRLIFFNITALIHMYFLCHLFWRIRLDTNIKQNIQVYLSGLRYAHRDLAARNVLLVNKTAKVCKTYIFL